jgi:hypothetical protein
MKFGGWVLWSGVVLAIAAGGCSPSRTTSFRYPPPLDTTTADIVRECRQDANAQAEVSTRKEYRNRVAGAAYSDCLTRRGVPR